jgi:uncharacterized protein (DUF433 family)
MTIHPDPIPLRADPDGAIRIGLSRVTLDTVVDYYNQGVTPEELATDYFPSLVLADVHAAIAYYLRHQDEINAYMQLREAQTQTTRAEHESAQTPFLTMMKDRMALAKAKRSNTIVPPE